MSRNSKLQSHDSHLLWEPQSGVKCSLRAEPAPSTCSLKSRLVEAERITRTGPDLAESAWPGLLHKGLLRGTHVTMYTYEGGNDTEGER